MEYKLSEYDQYASQNLGFGGFCTVKIPGKSVNKEYGFGAMKVLEQIRKHTEKKQLTPSQLEKTVVIEDDFINGISRNLFRDVLRIMNEDGLIEINETHVKVSSVYEDARIVDLRINPPYPQRHKFDV